MLQPCRHLASVGPVHRGEVASYPLDRAEELRRRGAVRFEGQPVPGEFSGSASALGAIFGEAEAPTGPPAGGPVTDSPATVAPVQATDPKSFKRFGKRSRR